jgi:predicted RecA/RadA family phage recombinase
MAVTGFQFVSGNPTPIDYTPASAVSGGDAVLQTGLLAFAKTDIAANDLGALHVGGVWEGPLAESHSAVAVGADLFYDSDGTRDDSDDSDSGCLTTTDTGTYVGKAVPNDGDVASGNAAETTDERVRFIMAAGPIEDNAQSS